jgi:ketosteroid isomerase-like protein
MDEASAWVARAAITELITRYAALNDAGDWDAVAALYTEDGRMNRPTVPG